MTTIVVVNLNPSAATRTGTRALVRAFQRLDPGRVRVLERHFTRVTSDELGRLNASGVVLGPQGVPFDAYPDADRARLFAFIRALEGPVLGVCGGHQALALAHGGTIAPVHGGAASGTYQGLHKELGFREVVLDTDDPMLAGLPARGSFYASHVEGVSELPPPLRLIGSGDPCRVQVIRVGERPQYGVQFHPERGGDGIALLRAFLSLVYSRAL